MYIIHAVCRVGPYLVKPLNYVMLDQVGKQNKEDLVAAFL